jgi:dolichyl-phosphate beta-glucosyltransferase
MHPCLSHGYDVVIGSRAMRESQIEKRQPLFRQIGGKGFGIFMHAVVGLKGITDTQCGFKFFTRAAAREIFRGQRIDGYMFDVEILAIARRLGYRIEQIPIRWRDDGDSRLALLSGNMRNVMDIFRIRLAQSRGSDKA